MDRLAVWLIINTKCVPHSHHACHSGTGGAASQLHLTFGAIWYVHVPVNSLKLIQHLTRSFIPGLYLFGTGDPSDVIVLLISSTTEVAFHQPTLKKHISNKIWSNIWVWIILPFKRAPSLAGT